MVCCSEDAMETFSPSNDSPFDSDGHAFNASPSCELMYRKRQLKRVKDTGNKINRTLKTIQLRLAYFCLTNLLFIAVSVLARRGHFGYTA